MTHPLDTLDWPVRTGRLLLRRAAPEDLDATWAFRRLPEVHDWLGAATATYDAYRERYFRGGLWPTCSSSSSTAGSSAT